MFDVVIISQICTDALVGLPENCRSKISVRNTGSYLLIT